MNKKILSIILIIVFLLIAVAVFFESKFIPAKTFEWGITFSHKHAQDLGFDWKIMYLDMLNDLKPKKLRLMTYWETVEPKRGEYNFTEIDEMLIEADKRNLEVILVVGHKQPRWPECHHPDWWSALSEQERNNEQLKFVQKTVEHFENYSSIKIWQVENEPLFAFGPNCPVMSKDLLTSEMELVRSLDNRPILHTDSGELGRWLPAARMNPDILAPTMYRMVHSPKTGYFKYPLPPIFFRIKAGIVKTFSNVDTIIGSELQAEPWFSESLPMTDLKNASSLMNPKVFASNIEYAKSAGFGENYLWGVEWWYWMAKNQGDWGMWNAVKDLLSQN